MASLIRAVTAFVTGGDEGRKGPPKPSKQPQAAAAAAAVAPAPIAPSPPAPPKRGVAAAPRGTPAAAAAPRVTEARETEYLSRQQLLFPLLHGVLAFDPAVGVTATPDVANKLDPGAPRCALAANQLLHDMGRISSLLYKTLNAPVPGREHKGPFMQELVTPGNEITLLSALGPVALSHLYLATFVRFALKESITMHLRQRSRFQTSGGGAAGSSPADSRSIVSACLWMHQSILRNVKLLKGALSPLTQRLEAHMSHGVGDCGCVEYSQLALSLRVPAAVLAAASVSGGALFVPSSNQSRDSGPCDHESSPARHNDASGDAPPNSPFAYFVNTFRLLLGELASVMVDPKMPWRRAVSEELNLVLVGFFSDGCPDPNTRFRDMIKLCSDSRLGDVVDAITTSAFQAELAAIASSQDDASDGAAAVRVARLILRARERTDAHLSSTSRRRLRHAAKEALERCVTPAAMRHWLLLSTEDDERRQQGGAAASSSSGAVAVTSTAPRIADDALRVIFLACAWLADPSSPHDLQPLWKAAVIAIKVRCALLAEQLSRLHTPPAEGSVSRLPTVNPNDVLDALCRHVQWESQLVGIANFATTASSSGGVGTDLGQLLRSFHAPLLSRVLVRYEGAFADGLHNQLCPPMASDDSLEISERTARRLTPLLQDKQSFSQRLLLLAERRLLLLRTNMNLTAEAAALAAVRETLPSDAMSAPHHQRKLLAEVTAAKDEADGSGGSNRTVGGNVPTVLVVSSYFTRNIKGTIETLEFRKRLKEAADASLGPSHGGLLSSVLQPFDEFAKRYTSKFANRVLSWSVTDTTATVDVFFARSPLQLTGVPLPVVISLLQFNQQAKLAFTVLLTAATRLASRGDARASSDVSDLLWRLLQKLVEVGILERSIIGGGASATADANKRSVTVWTCVHGAAPKGGRRSQSLLQVAAIRHSHIGMDDSTEPQRQQQAGDRANDIDQPAASANSDGPTKNGHPADTSEKKLRLECIACRVMKSRRHMAHHELLAAIVEQAAHTFPVTIPQVKTVIEDLIEREFFSRSEEDRHIICYSA